MEKLFRYFSLVLFFVCSAVLMLIIFGYSRIPDEISMQEFNSMSANGTYICQALKETAVSKGLSDSIRYETSVMLFNIFPIKNAGVSVSERKYVVPGGNIFGIRLYTQGVMVVKIDGVPTQDGNVNPGAKAGLKTGDIILSADGVSVSDNASLSKIISSSQGRTIALKIKRNDEYLDLQFTPVFSSADAVYKGGLWIRDSTAGIGTMTYYDRRTGTFAGLGHAVCDVDTGEIMPLSGGDAVEAVVKGCYKGSGGIPGELCGVFSSKSMGELYINGNTGIFGVLSDFDKTKDLIPVALPAEVKPGKAQIISTVDENEEKYYDIEITKVYRDAADQRNLVIKVTDEELIEKTGGIVQGMSGSPIIQNGMLAGAVTHVFVDNAREGYGILIQNMTDTQAQLEQNLAADKAG